MQIIEVTDNPKDYVLLGSRLNVGDILKFKDTVVNFETIYYYLQDDKVNSGLSFIEIEFLQQGTALYAELNDNTGYDYAVVSVKQNV
jgi:hypothetical protein